MLNNVRRTLIHLFNIEFLKLGNTAVLSCVHGPAPGKQQMLDEQDLIYNVYFQKKNGQTGKYKIILLILNNFLLQFIIFVF